VKKIHADVSTIRELHNAGMRNIDIARLLDTTRQRVWQVLNYRKKTKAKKIPPDMVDLPLTVGQAAESLGVHVNTLRRWANQGNIQCFRVGNRRDRRFRPEDIKEEIHLEEVPRLSNTPGRK
jgi:excisionase family DNA binding protein